MRDCYFTDPNVRLRADDSGNLVSIVASNGRVFPISDFRGSHASLAALQVAYPAASNPGCAAMVGTELFRSNGVTWQDHAAEHEAMGARTAAQLATTPTADDIALGDGTVFYDVAAPTLIYKMSAAHDVFVALGDCGQSHLEVLRCASPQS